MSNMNTKDKGTPHIDGEMVDFTIDGFKARAPKGTSILRAASDIGINIPKLCATDIVKPYGSCRLCLVEIEGRTGTPSSCTTPIACLLYTSRCV